jgi:hypothetical protein
VLIWILFVLVTGFLLEGSRIASTRPDYEVWSFVGYTTASIFLGMDQDALKGFHKFIGMSMGSPPLGL